MKKRFHPSVSVILPDIRSCHNVGALFRTADACGIGKVYLTGYTPKPPRKEIHKVALGAEESVPWEYEHNTIAVLERLTTEGVTIYALEDTPQAAPLNNIHPSGPIALLLGNETDGLPPLYTAFCTKTLRIPMHGMKESLNVSVAGGIALYVLSERLRGNL